MSIDPTSDIPVREELDIVAEHLMHSPHISPNVRHRLSWKICLVCPAGLCVAYWVYHICRLSQELALLLPSLVV